MAHRRLEWAQADDSHELYKPNSIQVRFRGLFAPTPQVVIHGPYHDSEFVEAALVELADNGNEILIPRALDGCLVRLIDRWENKQLEQRIATFSRLKILHGERNKHYRLRVTWYEPAGGVQGTFQEVASVTTAQTFTIRAHHSKRGAPDPDEDEAPIGAAAPPAPPTPQRKRGRTAAAVPSSAPASLPAPAHGYSSGQAAIGIPTPAPAVAPMTGPLVTTPASSSSSSIYSYPPQPGPQYVHAFVNNTAPVVRHVPRKAVSSPHASATVVQIPSRTQPSMLSAETPFLRSTENVATGLRRSRRLSAASAGGSNSSVTASIAASSNSSIYSMANSVATASSAGGSSALTDSREAQLQNFSDEDLAKLLADQDPELSALALPEQRRDSGFFSRRAYTPDKRGH